MTAQEQPRAIRLTVHAQIASMKNRRIPIKSNPYKTIPNAAARAFERDFLLQVKTQIPEGWVPMGSLHEPLSTVVHVTYPDMRSDLSVEIAYDLLQKSGVISNDRFIRRKVELASISKEPLVQIEVFFLESRA